MMIAVSRAILSVALMVAGIGCQSFSLLDGIPSGRGLVFDERHQRALVFGGGQRWDWRGKWHLDATPMPPAPYGWNVNHHDAHRHVYDGHRGVVYQLTSDMQVVEWDGDTFHTYSNVVVPPVRTGFMLSFDRIRRRLVLFGGANTITVWPGAVSVSVPRNDTWEWDGQAWTQASGVMPQARYNAHMAFDQQRGYTVLVGGASDVVLSGTWLWNGSWQAMPSATAIDGPQRSNTVFDPGLGAVVLVQDNVTSRQLLAFDGSQWNAHPAPPVVATGGGSTPLIEVVPTGNGELLAQQGRRTWHRASGQWSEVTQPIGGVNLWDPARNQLLVYDGTGTRVWRQGWHDVSSPAPPERASASLAFDTARAQAVLFGGSSGSFLPVPSLDDTWTFDGMKWQQQAPQNSPPARHGHAFAYDSANQCVVLFGGRVIQASPPSTTLLDDTWTWDGTNWQQHFPSVSPGPRMAQMVYDPVRQRCVLAGGSDGAFLGLPLTDTWEWDGSNWSLRAAADAPTGLVYDPTRQQVVSWARSPPAFPPGSSPQPAVYWDGSAWVPFTSTVPIDDWPTVYDANRDRWLRAGVGGLEVFGPTPHSAVPYGNGCGAIAPVIASSGGASIGNSDFELSVATHHANTPTFLLFSLQQSQLQLGGECTLLVADPSLQPGLAGDGGFADFLVPVPDLPALRGLTVHVQGAMLDTSSPIGVTLTRGLTLTIGD